MCSTQYKALLNKATLVECMTWGRIPNTVLVLKWIANFRGLLKDTPEYCGYVHNVFKCNNVNYGYRYLVVDYMDKALSTESLQDL